MKRRLKNKKIHKKTQVGRIKPTIEEGDLRMRTPSLTFVLLFLSSINYV